MADKTCVVCDQPLTDTHECPPHILAAMQAAEERVDQEGDVDYPDVIPGDTTQDARYSRGFAMLGDWDDGSMWI